ncbi:efflux transporter outer membrane subunit [Gallaecimonas kandeliae]|uniref:efflux transporter outer membrane subunit n=1 Tax=Gallaecimonas kandeliae TaxID=3029055 RepID=UPI002648C606|nr:efflux transporter outer membrane subunit [Gallaecimonas kandeliae]WKE67340.1 efflux transporter outer membrane subunit [Gallaecimonas kandeliae]
MNNIRFPLSSVNRCLLWAWLTAGVVAASGCAQIPDLGPAPQLKAAGQLATVKSFSAPFAHWPGDHWWESFGDTQLNELIEEALRGSPDLALAQARLRKAGAAVQGAGAPLLPQVSANAAFTQEKQSYNALMPRSAVPQGWNDYGQATLDLTWELDFWGKNRAALAAAISTQQAAQAELAQTRLVLSTSIASAYAELAHLFTVLDTAEATLSISTKTVELFQQRHQQGLENLASLKQVEARQSAAQAALLLAKERVALQRNAIAALLGAGPDRGLAITRPTARLTDPKGLPANLALELIGRRPDIVAARRLTEAAAKRIDQQKAGFYPSVNLVAFAGYQSLGIDNLTKSGSDIGAVGPAISLPIFNTARLQGQLRGARADYDAAVASYNGTLSEALREVADAVTSRKALAGEIAASRAAVAAAEEAHRLVSKRYQGKLATYLDVLSAEDELISAKRALADMTSRALVLNVALVRALGGGYQAPGNPTPTSGTPE